MEFLVSIWKALVPVVLDHGGGMVRDWWKARVGQAKSRDDGRLSDDVDQLKKHARQVDSDLDALNTAFTAREEKLRKWILTLVVWNLAITVTLVALAVFAIHS